MNEAELLTIKRYTPSYAEMRSIIENEFPELCLEDSDGGTPGYPQNYFDVTFNDFDIFFTIFYDNKVYVWETPQISEYMDDKNNESVTIIFSNEDDEEHEMTYNAFLKCIPNLKKKFHDAFENYKKALRKCEQDKILKEASDEQK